MRIKKAEFKLVTVYLLSTLFSNSDGLVAAQLGLEAELHRTNHVLQVRTVYTLATEQSANIA